MEISEEDFSKHIDALATRILDQPKKMATQVHKYWNEIYFKTYEFDRGLSFILVENNLCCFV